MKRVGIREFRDHAAQFLAGDEVLAIERHGDPIGFYIPTGKSQRESFEEALARLEQTVQQVLTETGMSEEDLSRLLDIREPLPNEASAGLRAPSRWREHPGGRGAASSGPATPQ